MDQPSLMRSFKFIFAEGIIANTFSFSKVDGRISTKMDNFSEGVLEF